MKLIFLGTGTSQGVPVVTCRCSVCCSNDPKDKRLRTSALIQTEQTSVVIDAGPDFRTQMLRVGLMKLDAVLLTHSHHDHVSGLDDVRAYNYTQKMSMPVFGTQSCLEHVKRYYEYAFGEDKYPGVPDFQMKTIDQQPFYVNELKITPLPVLHGQMPIVGFRFHNLAYITDASHIPEATLQLLQNLDVLVINALRHAPHHSHFTFGEVFEIIDILKPKQAFLTHISHTAGLHDRLCSEMPEGIQPAFDGLEIIL